MGSKKARRIWGIASVTRGLEAGRRIQDTQLEGRNLSGQPETPPSARAFVRNFSKDYKEEGVNQFLEDLSSNFTIGVELPSDSVMLRHLGVSDEDPLCSLSKQLSSMVLNEGFAQEDVLDMKGDVKNISSKLHSVHIAGA